MTGDVGHGSTVSGRYSRERMAPPRPPGPLAYAERVQRGVPIEVQPLDAEHPESADGSSAASTAGPWPCGQSAAVNSASRGRKLTGKPVTESNLSFRAPVQVSVRYVVVGRAHDYRCRAGRGVLRVRWPVACTGDRRAAHPRRRMQRKVIRTGRDERTLLRLSRISIARCADLIRSSGVCPGSSVTVSPPRHGSARHGPTSLRTGPSAGRRRQHGRTAAAGGAGRELAARACWSSMSWLQPTPGKQVRPEPKVTFERNHGIPRAEAA